MRQAYAERIDVLKTIADKDLDGVLDVVRAEAGIRTLAWLKTRKSNVDAAQRERENGLEVEPLLGDYRPCKWITPAHGLSLTAL